MSEEPRSAAQSERNLVETPVDVERPVDHDGTMVEISETPAWTINGGLLLVLALVLMVGGIVLVATYAHTSYPVPVIGGIVLILLSALCFSGLTIISPGGTKVVRFFGAYIGTIRETGLVGTIPLSAKKHISVKARNFETNELKVNDANGNPINIAAIIVWQVADTAKSVFAVENFNQFVAVQSEAALRHVATSHPYDNPVSGEETLRGSTDLVAKELASEVAERVAIAGLEIVETRISSLAYAPEIAQAMLQRQQAAAVIAAREKIVEGAVSMVQGALARLEEQGVVVLDEERKAAMVSNLLVVLCGESRATPIVNAGSLY